MAIDQSEDNLSQIENSEEDQAFIIVFATTGVKPSISQK